MHRFARTRKAESHCDSCFDDAPQSVSMTRRGALQRLAAVTCASGAIGPGISWAQAAMPTRAVPRTGERLPIVGLGSTRPVQGIAELGSDRVAGILAELVAAGGKVVDTWPRDAAADAAFGEILARPDFRDELFVNINLVQDGIEATRAHFDQTMRHYGRETIDLVNVGNLANIESLWPLLQSWQEDGRARYIGTTAAQAELHSDLESFVAAVRPEFVMVNYSISERQAERSLLPLCADLGVAVLVSRPFMNGSYFERLEDVALPGWTSEMQCETWAEFSLLYILANPAVTCVLTETTNPLHMAENVATALKPFPDERARARMREFIDSV